MNKPSIAFYLGHDAGVAVTDGKRTFQIELEKIIQSKHYEPSSNPQFLPDLGWCFDKILQFLERDYGIKNDFDKILVKGFYYKDVDRVMHDMIRERYVHQEFIILDSMEHHRIHTWSAYHQSPFNRAMVFSYDGGGDNYYGMISALDGSGTIFNHGNLFNMGWLFCNTPDLLFQHCISASFGNTLSARKTRIDHAGKLMGLSAYGKYGPGSYEAIEYYFKNIFDRSFEPKDRDFGMGMQLVKFWRRRASGPRGWQGMTEQQEMQVAWEIQEIALIAVKKAIEKYILPRIEDFDNNLVLTGGCALNVLVNKMIREEFPFINTYVPSDPGDAGLALGLLKEHFREELPKSKYPHLSDTRLSDFEEVDQYIADRNATEISLEDLNEIISAGKIVGFIYGGIEVGPRALCRRSILCDASYPDMKDILNKRVKHREWYRPFAPVVCEEDAPTYFEASDYRNLEHMSYALNVREEWQEKLSAITHVDGTARVQTLTREECPYIYDLLKLRDTKVLLNTSFNIGGRPILNSMKDALWMLDNRDMDHVVLIHNDKIYKFNKGESYV